MKKSSPSVLFASVASVVYLLAVSLTSTHLTTAKRLLSTAKKALSIMQQKTSQLWLKW